MHAHRNRILPPWERRTGRRNHPVGRARRRWPRAYDGAGGPVNDRYQAHVETDLRRERRRSSRSRSALDTLRQSPVRNGLIGLAVAGTAAPIAVNRYQQAMRTDPSHERVFSQIAAQTPVSDQAVSRVWNAMETEANSAATQRETTVQAKLEQYRSYNLTRELAEDIYDIATKADVDVDVAFGLVRAESAFKNTATSHVGAMGLTQLMPRSAEWLEPGTTRSDLRDPETNLRIGFKYLRQLTDKYDGNLELALLAYNRGPGTVDRVLKRGGDPNNGYVDMVLKGDSH